MMNKGHDGWVPFDEMFEHMKQGITAQVTGELSSQEDTYTDALQFRSNLEHYITTRIEALRSVYVDRLNALDCQAVLICLAKYSGLADVANHIGMQVETKEQFGDSR